MFLICKNYPSSTLFPPHCTVKQLLQVSRTINNKWVAGNPKVCFPFILKIEIVNRKYFHWKHVDFKSLARTFWWEMGVSVHVLTKTWRQRRRRWRLRRKLKKLPKEIKTKRICYIIVVTWLVVYIYGFHVNRTETNFLLVSRFKCSFYFLILPS